MSDSKQEMFLKLASIKTLRGSYEAGVLKAASSPKYPPKPTLLDRVSLWLVTPHPSIDESRVEYDCVSCTGKAILQLSRSIPS